MAGMIDRKKALGTLGRYFTLLEKTGYVKQATVRKYIVYLFLLDFVEYAGPFITEDDYILIDKLMRRIFTGGGCLLPYPVFCTNSAYIGRSDIINE